VRKREELSKNKIGETPSDQRKAPETAEIFVESNA
jgi:hypothetical protein